MGNTQQHRSQEARRNYETLEKRRARAAKRKQFIAKRDASVAQCTAWIKQNPKKLVAIILAAVAALMLLNAAVYALMPVKPLLMGPGGQPIGKQDNWLIIDCSEDRNHPKYYHLANLDIPVGYQKGDFTVFTDDVQQDFHCTSVAEDHPIQDFYVSATKNLDSEAYIERLLDLNMHINDAAPKTATIAGQQVNTLYLVFDEADTDGEGMAYSSLLVYQDTPQGSAVSCMINGSTVPMANILTEEALLAAAEDILAGLTILK